MKEQCSHCMKEWSFGPIYFAHDRKFCSNFCRQKSLEQNPNFNNKYEICWKTIPLTIESSTVITPLPSMKSSLSLLKGMDEISLNNNKFNTNLLNNKEILFNKSNRSENNSENRSENRSEKIKTVVYSTQNDVSYFKYVFGPCLLDRKYLKYPTLLLNLFG